jgi:hypothetical protein
MSTPWPHLPSEDAYYTKRFDWIWTCQKASCNWRFESNGYTCDDIQHAINEVVHCQTCKYVTNVEPVAAAALP